MNLLHTLKKQVRTRRKRDYLDLTQRLFGLEELGTDLKSRENDLADNDNKNRN